MEDRKEIILHPPKPFRFLLSSDFYGYKYCQQQSPFSSILERESVVEIHKLVCIYEFLYCKTFILISSGNHTKDINSMQFSRME